MSELYREGYTQNRELSWLRFNDRVLSEAMDETVPLLERLKFIAIFTSNLDEFFMIRAGSLFDLMQEEPDIVDNKSGMTPGEQLGAIFDAVRPLYQKKEALFHEVERLLRYHDICDLGYRELEKNERACVKQYYEAAVAPVLSPQIVDVQHPFPHLANKVIHVGVMLRHKNREVFGVLPLPAALPDVFYLPGSETRYIRMENIVLEYAKKLFHPYEVLEKTILCVTRNADVNPDDETFADETDFRQRMKKVLNRRNRLAPVRLELSNAVSPTFLAYLKGRLGLDDNQIYITDAPLRMEYVYGLIARAGKGRQGPQLLYAPFLPVWPAAVSRGESLLHQVERRDILLSFPFESMDPFLALLREAGRDPAVISIKITIYRLARKAKLVEYLCAAAENGKSVTVLIELRARFDEQNNIDWSERLEEAGCTILYGFDSFKVHSKVCLITRRSRGGVQYITQVGTGNYNENTAALYTDLSLITANQEIGQDAAAFFNNMSIGNLEGEYRHLLVAPVSFKPGILRLIDGQIEKGAAGRILIKINSLTDADIIAKLSEASRAGVQVRMIVRGICCLLPGVPGRTENIRISSIVGRYLEHTRVYCFGAGAEMKMYISSADFMTRNTERRVEVACPIYDGRVRDRIRHILEAQEYDTRKARVLRPDGVYARSEQMGEPLDSQQLLMDEAERSQAPLAVQQREGCRPLRRLLRRIREAFGR